MPPNLDTCRLPPQVNPGSWARFRHKAHINVGASCRGQLYEVAGPHEDRCVMLYKLVSSLSGAGFGGSARNGTGLEALPW